ncbi:hypothetical protein SCHPADRAFT_91805 [Schizopora paradoxa]|uniref:Uncharacterized protein n=1 Tax=Schizopora paradoxa TaxID=27342 RepID=A0A0H2S5B2_9AGAM|nr:hypothetical protein SCHPADRAFT_91805 [Schizopora paradoxa]
MDLLERVEAQASHRRLRRCSQPQTFCQNSRLRSKLQRQPDLHDPIEQRLKPWRLTSQISIKDDPSFALALQAHRRALPPTTTISSSVLSLSLLYHYQCPPTVVAPFIGGRAVFSPPGAPQRCPESSERALRFIFVSRAKAVRPRTHRRSLPPVSEPGCQRQSRRVLGFWKIFLSLGTRLLAVAA